MKLKDLRVRDPFILPYKSKYYLIFSPTWNNKNGFYITVSEDLENWSEPTICFDPPKDFWANKNFWAPEMHFYKGNFYIFASFGAEGKKRATQILKSKNPEGPFEVWSPPLTPNNKNCIDGTLYVEDDIPYLIYSHEVIDDPQRVGSLWLVKLTEDLKATASEHSLIFKGSAPKWSEKKWDLVESDPLTAWVAEGPFFYKTANGELLMLWSSHTAPDNYAEVISYTKNGSVFGDWKHSDKFLMDKNGGHGMLFKDFDGNLKFTLHSPDTPHGAERAVIHTVVESKEEPFLSIK